MALPCRSVCPLAIALVGLLIFASEWSWCHPEGHPGRRLNQRTDLVSFPSIPNLLHGPQCPVHWSEVQVLTPWLRMSVRVAVLILVTLACIVMGMAWTWNREHFCHLGGGASCILSSLYLVMVCLVGLWMGTQAACSQFLMQNLQQLHMMWPQHWWQLSKCHMQLISFPKSSLPIHAGLRLTEEEQNNRQMYFISLLLLLWAFGAFVGACATFLGRAFRKCRPGRTGHVNFYDLLKVEPETENQVEFSSVPLWVQGGTHVFSATLAMTGAVTGRLDRQFGACWELYVVWEVVVLTCQLSQAIYFSICLPCESHLPQLTWPVVEPVVPVLGEHLDIFKDWLFVGIAFSEGSRCGIVVAVAAIVILGWSSFYIRTNHSVELMNMMLPVQSICTRKREGFLARATSPGKLAVALTEDLPQACLQVVFAKIAGGSLTQTLFIAVSCAKIVACLTLRAVALRLDNRYGEAQAASEVLWEGVVILSRKLLGPKNTVTLAAQDRLAWTLNELGRLEEGLKLLGEVHEKRVEVQGRNHPSSLATQEFMAWTSRHLGRPEEALKQEEELLAARLQALGPTHPSTLNTRHNMASTLTKLQRFQEASTLQQDVLAKRVDVLGLTHPDTLATQHCLALTLAGLGQYDEALKLEEEVLQKRSQILGPKHPSTLVSEQSMASILRSLGRLEEALQFQAATTAKCMEVFGSKHPDTLDAQRSLTSTLTELGQIEEALKLQEQVLATCSKVLGPTHLSTLAMQHTMATTLAESGKLEDALKLLEKVVTKRLEILGPIHPSTLDTQHALASTLTKLQRFQEASTLQQDVLAKRVDVLGLTHPDTLATQHCLALTLAGLGQYDEALKLEEEVLQKRSQILGPKHPSTLVSEQSMASILRSLGRLEEALQFQAATTAK